MQAKEEKPYVVDGLEVAQRPANPLEKSTEFPIPPLEPGKVTVFKKGSCHAKGYMPLPLDIERVQDIAIPLRDGTTVYGDLYRKLGEGPVPVIVVYTMYSKQGGSFNEKFSVVNTGVSKSEVSGLQCFESPDPAYWCQHGYAICVVDQRGCGHSEGNMVFMGKQAGRDAADVIDFIGEQDFCTGAVTMMGNSQLAMIQWAAAEAAPAHLKAIAPFEGLRDQYRDSLMRGGIPDYTFHDTDIIPYLYGEHEFEDVTAMAKRYPLVNAYWDDKVADVSRVEIPAYVVASWTHAIHTRNSINGYRELGSAVGFTEKWLRVHDTHEWQDLVNQKNSDDLRRFFDHYLKGEDNGWEKTPHVRYARLDFNAKQNLFASSETYPAVPTRTMELRLNAASGSMGECPAGTLAPATVSYDAVSEDVGACARFEWRIDREMEIHGASNLRFWVSTSEGDDADLYACLYKKDAHGRVRYHVVFPAFQKKLDLMIKLTPKSKQLPGGPIYVGPTGKLRASHRKLDPARSTECEPYLTHDELQPLTPGEPVLADLGLWPTDMLLHKGETLVLEVAGHTAGPVAEARATDDKPVEVMKSANAGKHTIHTGGEHDSVLYLPIVEL